MNWRECNLVWHHTKFNYQFVTIYLFDLVACSRLKSKSKKAYTSHFVPDTDTMQYRAKMVRFKTKMMRFRSRCDSWIDHTAESQSDCRDHQWFENGYNKWWKVIEHLKKSRRKELSKSSPLPKIKFEWPLVSYSTTFQN